MKRTYIKAVKPLDGHILKIEYINGSVLMLNLSGKLDLLRFCALKNPNVWQSATTNGIFVRFEGAEFSHDELLAFAEET